MLSLIRKANKLILSKEILNSFRYHKVHYVFIASDASDKTKQRYQKKCSYYNVPCNMTYDSEALSRAIGKQNVMTIGITDKGFADALIKKEEENG